MIHGATIARPRRADGPAAFVRVFGRRLRGSISPVAVNSLAQAIQQQEGYYPGSLAYRNNNPGNLVYAGQPGATLGAGGFASFPSYSAGYQALENQITLDVTRGTDVNGNPVTTVGQLISSWAPPSENDTATYIANVSASTGFDPNASLSSLGAGTLDFSTVDTAGVSGSLDSTVDLSSLGISTPVPVYAIAGVAVLALLLFRN